MFWFHDNYDCYSPNHNKVGGVWYAVLTTEQEEERDTCTIFWSAGAQLGAPGSFTPYSTNNQEPLGCCSETETSFAPCLLLCESIPILSLSLTCGIHALELGTMVQYRLSVKHYHSSSRLHSGAYVKDACSLYCTGNDWDSCCICI